MKYQGWSLSSRSPSETLGLAHVFSCGGHFWEISRGQEKLQISRVTALKLVGSGTLKAQKIGRRWWVNEEDLISFLEGEERS